MHCRVCLKKMQHQISKFGGFYCMEQVKQQRQQSYCSNHCIKWPKDEVWGVPEELQREWKQQN